MASDDTKPGIAVEARHVYGPRPVGAVLPRLTRAAFRRHSRASALIMADWTAIVGPALGAITTPRRLAAGTLTLACSGPIALELQHLAAEVIARINAHLGSTSVQRLRFVQQSYAMAPVQGVPPIPAKATEAAKQAVADLPEGELRDALASLGSLVIASRTIPSNPEKSR